MGHRKCRWQLCYQEQLVWSLLGRNLPRLAKDLPKGDHYLQWIIKPDFDKEEEFHIQSVGSGQWLNGRAKAGQFAYISREPDVKKAPDYFKWTIEKVGNQYRFLSKTSKCYLDGRDSGYGNQDNVVGITPSKPSSERYLLWDLVTIDGNYCLKSDSSGFWLDGRNDNFTGDQLWLSPRTPSSGDDALIWKIYKV